MMFSPVSLLDVFFFGVGGGVVHAETHHTFPAGIPVMRFWDANSGSFRAPGLVANF